MEIIFNMVGTITVILIILLVCFALYHYFFYSLSYIFRGKNKTLEYLSLNTHGLNLLLYIYILMLLPLLLGTGMGLLDSFGIINLNELLTNIKIALNIDIEIKDIHYSIYRIIALLMSFLLVLFNLLFIVKKKYTFFIKQMFIKAIE